MAIVTIYSQARTLTESTKKGKPKAYFQFWGFHLPAIILVVYMAKCNFEAFYFFEGFICIVVVVAHVIGFQWFDVETPTHCCRCSWCFCIFHSILLEMSVTLIALFAMYFIFSIPTIILVYYLYPTRTLIRLPLIINAVLYTSSLPALLLFQCERCCHPCTRHCVAKKLHGKNGCLICCKSRASRCALVDGEPIPLEERATNHDNYYATEYENIRKKNNRLACVTYVCHPIATLLVLIIFIFFVITISELLDLHRQSSDSNFKLILTLVPSLVLLFGSWYKLDVFFDIEKEKSKKELLEEILQEIKESNNQELKEVTSPPQHLVHHLSNQQVCPFRANQQQECPNLQERLFRTKHLNLIAHRQKDQGCCREHFHKPILD